MINLGSFDPKGDTEISAAGVECGGVDRVDSFDSGGPEDSCLANEAGSKGDFGSQRAISISHRVIAIVFKLVVGYQLRLRGEGESEGESGETAGQ